MEWSCGRGTSALEVELELAVGAAAVQVEEVTVFTLIKAKVESIATNLNAESIIKRISSEARSVFAARAGIHLEVSSRSTGLTLVS